MGRLDGVDLCGKSLCLGIIPDFSTYSSKIAGVALKRPLNNQGAYWEVSEKVFLLTSHSLLLVHFPSYMVSWRKLMGDRIGLLIYIAHELRFSSCKIVLSF